MANRLGDTTSPYLLQHAENPVDWYPWCDEAFDRARAENKAVLVSVGYSACHWCHVMAHESFEDPATAAVMNALFVNVKVDREERPDIDAVTMETTVALTGHGGWPTTVFMTPEGRPFFAGTYFPPAPRHGMPSFEQLLRAVAGAWQERRDDLEAQAERIATELGAAARLASGDSTALTPDLLDRAEEGIVGVFEPRYGGFGGAPKFPAASAIEFLLRRGSPRAAEVVRRTLDGMAAGGMYDVVGGGFHRYSVDEAWLIPHFEKMLYDNALLAGAYLHAWCALGDDRYRTIAEETIEYMLRDLHLPEGGLASAQDADTNGVEGVTYTWTRDEWSSLGLDVDLLRPFEHGQHVVRGELDQSTRERLLAIRDRRAQPFRDDKAITAWNGLALAVISEAGRRLSRPDWVAAGREIAEFCLDALVDFEGRVARSYRAGKVSGGGYLDDYTHLAYGLVELHIATGEVAWLVEAKRLVEAAIEHFRDPGDGLCFLAPNDAEKLVTRAKDIEDDPTPSGNAMLALVAGKLARIWDDDHLRSAASGILSSLAPAIGRVPRAFAWSLCALDLELSPPAELAIVGDPTDPVALAALAPFSPNVVVAVGAAPTTGVPLLAGKERVGGRTTVYRCERFVCQLPVTDPASLNLPTA